MSTVLALLLATVLFTMAQNTVTPWSVGLMLVALSGLCAAVETGRGGPRG